MAATLNGNPPHSLTLPVRAGVQPVLPRKPAAERRNTKSVDTALFSNLSVYMA